jgi:tRNA G18 (ribose-2'-O)-methylase SpoU
MSGGGSDSGVLDVLDDAVEIPVYGLPHSYNVATAAAMALYEYARQHSPRPPSG